MPSPDSESPDDSFFNDLSQQPSESNAPRQSPPRTNGQEAQKEDAAGKPKRMACVLCRKRKLRCDGARPTCGTCKRLSHECAYDEVRKKSGPKRGYVKLLEQRLLQVESLLKNQEFNDQNKEQPQQDSTAAYVASTLQQGLPNSNDFLGGPDKASAAFADSMGPVPDTFQNNGPNANNRDGDFPWEMIGLGLEEPLPPQDVMDDLYQVYFNKIHSSIPIIHRPRFMAAMDLAPHMRPPVCLRYIMWAMAASTTDKYDALQEHFYQRARKYAQMDEMKGHGETTITVAHCQAWTLLCSYEFKQMYFPRAWLSAGRSVRLAQMMQLHRLDGAGLDVKQCLPPPKDWTEREERRRTFWMSFCIDRYAAIGTGWPVTIDETDILTNLPASEMAYEKSKPMPTGTLEQALCPNGINNLQPFGGIVLTAALFGRNLLHLHRPGPDDREDDLNAGFWTRHRDMEQILLQTSLGLPEYLRLPAGSADPNIVFLNMCLHTSAICLHQAAIFKADKYRLPVNVSNESKIRCVTAAAEIASIMRMISHMDLSSMNPFISFCVYVAARVFVQYLKTRPKDQQMNSSLQFLLQAMQALRRKNPLTESFLVQLDLDLESAGIMGNQPKPYLPPQQSGPAAAMATNSDSVACSPIFEIRESQSASAPMNQFGNGNANKQAPGAHFQVSNMDMQNNSYLSPQSGQLSRDGHSPADSSNFMNSGSGGLPSGFGLDGNEMDISVEPGVDQPSPATTINSQSRGGSTSHTSYSPGPQNEHHLPYRASPKVMSNPLNIAQTTASSSTQYFSTSDTMFSMNMYNNAGLNGDSMNNNFLMPNEWEFSGMSNTMGLAPMTDGGWNDMLESINLGWDSLGPPRDHTPHENKQR